MKIKLLDGFTLLNAKYYPFFKKKSSKKRHFVTLGVGANINNPLKTFEKLFLYFLRSNDFDLLCSSFVLKNPPFGYLDQPDFFNTIIILKTNYPPHHLLKRLHRIEKKFKRKRSFKDSPRSLDLDIIFFDKIFYDKKYLKIPHKEYHKRESVLIPLAYLKSKR